MSIKASYLVSLTPRVISNSARDLETNGMVLTKSALIPADQSAMIFTSATSVADFFGAESDESIFAQQYFTGLTNQQKAPSTLIIGRRIDEDVAAWIRSASLKVKLDELKKISDGSLSLMINGKKVDATAINLASATSMSDVATKIAEKLTGTTGAYNSNLNAFIFTTTTKGNAASIGFAPVSETGTPLAEMLGLTEEKGAVLSNGAAAQTESQALDAVASVTGNWSQFTTLWEVKEASEAEAYSAWADIADDFIYVFWSSDEKMANQLTQKSTIAATLRDKYNCTLMTYAKDFKTAAFVVAYPATIKWDQTQGMKVIFGKSATGLEPTVTTESEAVALDGLRVSYVGQFATRNDEFVFANRGALASDFYGFYDVLIASIWLRSKIQTAVMDGFKSVNKVPYNDVGYTMLRQWLADPIDQGLNVGAIDRGLALSESQKAQILQETGDSDSADDIETNGFWLQIKDPGASVRAQRGSPVMQLYVAYAGSVQKVELPVTTLI